MTIIISSVNVSLNGVISNYFLWPWLGCKTYIDRDFVYRNPLVNAWMSKAETHLKTHPQLQQRALIGQPAMVYCASKLMEKQ